MQDAAAAPAWNTKDIWMTVLRTDIQLSMIWAWSFRKTGTHFSGSRSLRRGKGGADCRHPEIPFRRLCTT